MNVGSHVEMGRPAAGAAYSVMLKQLYHVHNPGCGAYASCSCVSSGNPCLLRFCVDSSDNVFVFLPTRSLLMGRLEDILLVHGE